MKRGYDKSPSTSQRSPPRSRPRLDPPGVQQFLEDDSASLARKVADHYSARTNQTLEEREASPIIHLKKLNNWIKSVLIQLFAREGDAVLDLACGKGGDLIKWDKAKVGYYVGIDIADGSVGLDKALEDDGPFDICSCQFAMHYSWSTEARARQVLANVSKLFRPGGSFSGTMPNANVIVKRLRAAEGLIFGNDVYWIQFDEDHANKPQKFKSSAPFGIKYKFHLELLL